MLSGRSIQGAPNTRSFDTALGLFLEGVSFGVLGGAVSAPLA
jgi:hypothetical protein